MTPREEMLTALRADPNDETAWLALADALEEEGEEGPAELTRLHRTIRGMREGPKRREIEQRIQALLASEVRPVTPRIVNSIGMRLVLIPPGAFRMGSPRNEQRRQPDEWLHRVRLSQAFHLGVYPVTQDEFASVTRRRPSEFRRVKGVPTGQFPVECVSWLAAVEFCLKLSARKAERKAGRVYRLPTEAEWEYACRAWISPRFPVHIGPALQAGGANFDCRSQFPPSQLQDSERDWTPVYLERPCEVGRYAPNAFGLFDMHGNVDEWCADWYESDYYDYAPTTNPPGPAGGELRIVRGGSWSGQGEDCRAAVRIGYHPGARFWNVGFRVACDIGR